MLRVRNFTSQDGGGGTFQGDNRGWQGDFLIQSLHGLQTCVTRKGKG
uniref:Uncharacterized protein n=1 Tax=Glycine max TaxID=3847 RepID=A0A0R0F2T4_SOYBN